MAGQHVRCSDSVHKTLRGIAAREGVPLSKALEILVSTRPMEGQSEDDRVLEEFFGVSSDTKEDPAMAENMSAIIARLEEITSQLDNFCGNFSRSDQAGKLNIASELANSTDEPAPLAQPPHEHSGNPNCPGCIQYTEAAMNTAYNKGVAEATAYYMNIPGVRRLREIWEEAQIAHANGEQVLVIN